MTQAEVPQPISAIPARWGRFTAAQLGWMVIAVCPLYISIRAHLPALPMLLATSPWITSATAMAFGRLQGRRLDAFTADWVLYRLQRKRLDHPDSGPNISDRSFVVVDRAQCRPIPWDRS